LAKPATLNTTQQALVKRYFNTLDLHGADVVSPGEQIIRRCDEPACDLAQLVALLNKAKAKRIFG